jgi:hypothetical protein
MNNKKRGEEIFFNTQRAKNTVIIIKVHILPLENGSYSVDPSEGIKRRISFYFDLLISITKCKLWELA